MNSNPYFSRNEDEFYFEFLTLEDPQEIFSLGLMKNEIVVHLN